LEVAVHEFLDVGFAHEPEEAVDDDHRDGLLHAHEHEGEVRSKRETVDDFN
jgi:hypothetical protein